MKAGWVGQMVGVGWGAPTEFRWRGEIIPEDRVPKWKQEMVNQFGQDDIYVEMTFIRSLEEYGVDVPIRQAGIDFANSGYPLWHANKAGRDLLRAGTAPPDSGHPEFNSHADDIDYQIEADFSGLISPGLPNEVIRLGETFGRLMNYGDGLYGGQFVGCMYAEAFFEDDVQKIIAAGLECIPEESRYAETIRDVVKWHGENPDDWQKTWQLIEDKYQKNPDNRLFSCNTGLFNIDAKLNGAYIVLGLLYGEGDIEATSVTSMRAGQDSDCNPSNALGVLFTARGLEAIPDEYKSALERRHQVQPHGLRFCRSDRGQHRPRARPGASRRRQDRDRRCRRGSLRDPCPPGAAHCARAELGARAQCRQHIHLRGDGQDRPSRGC
jgi:hypothetical protein